MKVTSALKIELTQWLDNYWTTYLKGDIDTWATFIGDDYRNIGGTKEEIWNSKQEIVDYTKSIMSQMLGNVDIRNRQIELIPYGDYIMVNEFTDLYLKVEEEWILYGPFRMSSLLEKTATGWIALHQHGSYPDMKAMEGEAFSIDALKAENARLQAAVKSRTMELEIETALEKVRAEAMGMKKPDDILEICKVMFTELQLLGFSELRNTLINFWDDESSLLIDYDYSTDTGGNKAKLSYSSHPVFEQFQKKIKNSEDAFAELVVTKDELESWKQRRRDSGEYEDPRLNNIPALYYYFYSIGVGAIGISTFSSITEEKLNVLRRFRNVFDFAYRRYADVAQAEAQAKEAQIELSLERVRARTMAMQKSDELPDAANILFQQVQALGMPAWSAGYCIWDEEKKGITLWMSSEGVMQPSFHAPLTKDPSFIHMREAYERDEAFFVEEVGGQALVAHYQYMRTLPVVGEILDSIIAAGHPLPVFQIFHLAFFSQGFLLFITYEPVPEAHDIFKRFAKVFEQTYTRFLDLQKAEAQAREAQIEAALERVRSRSMGMQNSEELKEVIKIVYQQLINLKINLDHAGFVVDYTPGGDWHFWIADAQDIPSKISHPYFESVWANQFKDAKEKGSDIFTTHLNFEEKNKFYHELLSYIPGLPEASKDFYLNCPGLAASTVLFENVSLYIENFAGTPYSDEDNKTLLRFGKVFQQTYTRFLDLQKAETQARESETELALERVRARTMAMQQSEELAETATLVFQQFSSLRLLPEGSRIFFSLIDEVTLTSEIWTTKEDGILRPGSHRVSLRQSKHLTGVYESWKQKKSIYNSELTGSGVTDYLKYMASIPHLKEDKTLQQLVIAPPDRLVFTEAVFAQGTIGVIGVLPLTEEKQNVLARFAKVFEQTYTRFLDLQKAEAQAREAQIELALEKVRARTMAMQHSDELQEAANLLFQQVKALGIPALTCGYNIWEKDEQVCTAWMSSEDGLIQPSFKIPLTESATFIRFCKSRKKGESFYTEEVSGEALAAHYRYMLTLPVFGEIIAGFVKAGFTLPSFQINHVANFSHGNLIFISYQPVPEAWEIFKRFAKVFEQTYTRFLDLQKAEAQARESQIEAALERVRSVAMSMMKSDELLTVCEAVFVQLETLGFSDTRAAQIYIRYDEEEKFLNYDYSNISGSEVVEVKYNSHPKTRKIYDTIRNAGDALIDNIISNEELIAWRSYLYNILGQKPEKNLDAATELHYYLYSFGIGAFGVCTYSSLDDEKLQILKRFRNVFNLCYQRYTDIALAEAQAREAKIETALERVRSRTLAMQKSNELAETSAVLFQQLISLGIEPNRLYITIIKDEEGDAEFWITDEDGTRVSAAYTDNLNTNPFFKKMLNGWKEKQPSLIIDMHGQELQDYFTHLTSLHVPFKDGLTHTRRIQHLAYFNKGFIGMASPDAQPLETIRLLERFAAVFNLTYTRFNDLQIAEAHAVQAAEDLVKLHTEKKRAEDALNELRVTQKQLVQSEKMASLGELTAGIAHEIQNPLNFVNNFSEVSTELVNEMNEEIAKGNLEEARQIAEDLKQNLEKITHHGKRAGDIVKGMLQHSRTGGGQTESTDINKLADEYLRLAYHGLRAKDKSFNVTLNTDYDEAIGNINIVSQDIGRVILNLITNAFYAVNEKKKAESPKPKAEGKAYEPVVTVTTLRLGSRPVGEDGGKIEISVKDNGNGIAQKILDKIFQPFFTTKPTGQGTGLGLSLAYDIVKAHGGEIKVETKEGKGTEFIINLPIL